MPKSDIPFYPDAFQVDIGPRGTNNEFPVIIHRRNSTPSGEQGTAVMVTVETEVPAKADTQGVKAIKWWLVELGYRFDQRLQPESGPIASWALKPFRTR